MSEKGKKVKIKKTNPRISKSKKNTKRLKSKKDDDITDNITKPKIKHVHKKVMINVDENNTFKLDKQAHIEYHNNFITKKFHDELFEELLNNVPWTFGTYNMFGKPIKTPRLLFCMRDKDFNVGEVYKVTDSMEWTVNMLKLKKLVEKQTNRTYSYAQLNYYRNGDDYIGYHTDSEVQQDDIIASISLGASRKFSFRKINYKDNDSNIYEIILEGRSLILMNEYAAKKNWKHMLPKMKNVNDVRINITFRPK
jgi:alkylated DNA repair dioxygenase AlkB